MTTYFASYHLSFPEGQAFGMGSFDVPNGTLDRMIDVHALADAIKAKVAANSVIILSWREIDPDPVAKPGEPREPEQSSNIPTPKTSKNEAL